VTGFREQFPDVPVWDARDEGRLRESLAKAQPVVAVAVGNGAAAALDHAAPAELTILYTVVLASDLESEGSQSRRYRAAITIDLPPEALLSEVAKLFPGKLRIGVIRGPAQNEAYMKTFEQAARRNGLVPEVVNCDRPRDLVEDFLKLKARADLVWCPPNAQLYNSATLKPLLIASLTNRLPIIGFSEQFVQAGALLGGFADFPDVGRQTAALATRVARKEGVSAREPARRFRFAYNQRVARMLGLRAVIPEGSGEILVIR
jgi:putative ABC transport system substrate-binding protein